MSFIPVFQIGVWNAWILQVFFFLTKNTKMDRDTEETVGGVYF